MKYKVILGESARGHIIEIYKYIRDELKNPMSAEKITDDIYNKIESLRLFPKATPPHETPAGNKVYFAHIHNFTIVYDISNETVRISAVLYSRRNIAELI